VTKIFDTKSTHRLGNDGFYWFIGVIEDINDPLQLGRVRVRILGDHTQSKTLIPTDTLPWAYPVNDIHSASMQGMGKSPTGLFVKGAWVFGFYMDGMDKQQPVVMGSLGGIPESIPWKPKKADEEGEGNLEEDDQVEVGFQDPDMKFPMGHAIFEQDTNRLARNTPKDHAAEIPEDLVPKQEEMIEGGLCPKKPVYAKKYYDKFDEAFVRKFAQGESSKLVCDDSVVGNTQCKSGTKDLKVQDKKDEKCQYFLLNNDHPFTIYKFINRERFVPMAKPFADPMHQEHWHEPDNPWAAQYPYNMVWEGYHEEGSTTIQNPGNPDVSEAYCYNKTIEDYDGSAKEGIFRKQKCGIGSWGLGEEWDNTPGNQRYHRFHPAGNYFEIDKKGNEVRKIYGDGFEINVQDKSIYIKGDWNITVLGDKNELIMGDYNLQIMGDQNTDVRGDIKTHTDHNHSLHVREDRKLTIDGNDTRRIAGDRNTSILKRDYIESVDAERRADTIIRYGAKSIYDEGFMEYKLKVNQALIEICELKSQIDKWTSEITTMDETVVDYTEEILNLTSTIGIYDETVTTHNETTGTLTMNTNTLDETTEHHTETSKEYSEFRETYYGCVEDWELHTDKFKVYYQTEMQMEQQAFACMTGITDPTIPIPEAPVVEAVVFDEKAHYPETDGYQQCLRKYNECVEATKAACMTTLVDPRTLKEYTRIDWEKYHASIKSCHESYMQCIEANTGSECDICSPEPGVLEWECIPCHDPNCPQDDKTWEFYNCECQCEHSPKEEKKIDPWENCEREEP